MTHQRKRHTPDDWKTSLFNHPPKQPKYDKLVIIMSFMTGLIVGFILATTIN